MNLEHDALTPLTKLARYITPVGVVALLVLQGQFVTRNDFDVATSKLSGRVEKIEQVLIRMEASAAIDRHHDDLLADHETRIRTLESSPNPKPN
jgi:hypothetical protein